MKKVIISILVIIAIVAAYFVGARSDKTETETTTEVTKEVTTETTTQQSNTEAETQSTTETTQQDTFEGIKICLYYKTKGEFKLQDITEYIAEDINSAITLNPTEVERSGSGENIYIDPEIRVYGVGKDSSISVVFESEASKARNYRFDYNDGVSQFWYWNTKLYNVEREGVYSFRISVIGADKTENYAYLKLKVE